MSNRLICRAFGIGCLVMFAGLGAADAVKTVDCASGKKLADALEKADPGDVLRINGTCHERVIIRVDRITLQGAQAAVLDGGAVPGGGSFAAVVRIEGAQGVVLSGLTIRNGGSNGVTGQAGAAFSLIDSIVQDNKGTGIQLLDGANAEVVRSTIRNNDIGMDVVNRSGVVFRGEVVVSRNRTGGIETNGGCTLEVRGESEVRGGSLHVDENGGDGIVVSNSYLSLFGFPESNGSAITANGNAGNGMTVGNGNVLVVGGAGGFSFSITLSQNKGVGLALGLGSFVAPVGSLNLQALNNNVGVSLGIGSSMLSIGGTLNVRGNGTGIAADGADTLTLIASTTNASIDGNRDADVDLRFGTRSTIIGFAIGKMLCDGTVLSRGTKVCPRP